MGAHRFGYACINTELGLTTNKTCRLRNISMERLAGLIEDNLMALRHILAWNGEHQIGLFRIGSGIIPFGSHYRNTFNWVTAFSEQFAEIGQAAMAKGMRLTMHPGQFVNLNSPIPSVFEASIFDLSYHATVLGSMGLDTSCKMVTHVGGLYGDREASIRRFIKGYSHLPDAVKRRLVLENDDRLFTIWDVLAIHESTGIPVVFDMLHHEANNSATAADRDIPALIERCLKSWDSERDGIPKIHFATQKPGNRPGAHADAIDVAAFLDLFNRTKHLDYDVVFECKDKEQSVLRIQQALKDGRYQGVKYISN